MSKEHAGTKLSEFPATAICANDILSSVLYVSGLVIPIAGVWTPLIMLVVGLTLLLYKGVYREVVEAMPVNGGCYNALLNGTSKNIAATAGVLTILSYVATAVISAKSGVDYLSSIIPESILHGDIKQTSIILGTIFILGIFAALVISGVKDSAKVAIGIFSFHVLTLVAFVGLGFAYILTHGSKFVENMSMTQNLVDNLSRSLSMGTNQALLALLFLGFASSLLGVSGFESSANFVEEQEKGVFKKTLRNMLIGVTVFNPLVAFIALSVNTLPEIAVSKDFLLADEALIIGGEIFKYILVIDAFLVLCGAVLTSFVGISGLVNRMALDECLPLGLAKENKKGSFPIIIGAFFILCVSILLITQGNLTSLGGVYAISFLSVMSMFAFANLILKGTRAELKRYYSFPPILTFFALLATLIGVIGNTVAVSGKFGDFSNFGYFLMYFIPLFVFVTAFLYRDYLTLFVLKITGKDFATHKFFNKMINSQYALFIHTPARLFNALKYINNNEVGRNVLIVHCKDDKDEKNRERWEDLQTLVPVLSRAGVYSHLKLEMIEIDMPFKPEAISKIVKDYSIPYNRTFIGSIHQFHEFDYEELGGVRIIV